MNDDARKIIKEQEMFSQIISFVEFTSQKYSDSKEQFQLRLEGVLKDASKVGQDVGYIDLTRAKVDPNDTLGCRDMMLVYHRQYDLIKLITRGIFLMKCLVSNVPTVDAYKECMGYKHHEVIAKGNSNSYYDVSVEDLMSIYAEYIVKHIDQYRRINIEKCLDERILKDYYQI